MQELWVSADYATSDTVENELLSLWDIDLILNGNDFDNVRNSFLLLPASAKGRLKNYLISDYTSSFKNLRALKLLVLISHP